MALRLGDLLERIRPVGTPGAPTDAGPQRELVAIEEIGELVTSLARIEAEADAVIATARARAESVRSEAEHAARRIRADLPDLVAVAKTAGVAPLDDATDGEIAQIAASAAVEIDALRAGSDLDAIVSRVVDLIWQTVDRGRTAARR